MSKKCTKCQKVKAESEFHKNGRGGTRPDCKRCRTDAILASRNAKEASQRSLNYYYKNRTALSQRSLERYHENREQILPKVRAYKGRNADKIKAYQKSYRERPENRERARVHDSHQKAKRRGSEGHFTDEQWRLLCVKYDYTCLCCGIKAEDTPEGTLTIDHIVPLSKGGGNSISNIQPLCKLCNCRKAKKTIDYRR